MRKKYFCVILFAVISILFLYKWNQVEKVELVNTSSQSFDKAVVTKIITDNIQENKSRIGNQTVMLRFLSGRRKGQEVEAVSTNGNLYGATCYVGTKVIALTNESGEVSVTSVYSFDREYIILAFCLIFFLAIGLIGGKNGVKAILGLVYTLVLIIYFFLPAIYRGMSPILAAVLVVIFTTVITMLLLTGTSRKSIAAMIGTIAGVVVAGISAGIFGAVARISGYNVPDIDSLIFVQKSTNISVGGLLFAGILISALGAVMDVAMSIASAIHEFHEVDESLGWQELYKRGMNVGRDMMGTMANTLILAFVGGSLSTLVLNYAYNLPYLQIMNSYSIGIEIMQGLSGSIGIVLTVPLVSFAASVLIKREKTGMEESGMV
ncbi:MAG: YibE/F family protein [Clostridiales bacterium]|nr:YibE/F family protein [Clostridiales bacterium]